MTSSQPSLDASLVTNSTPRVPLVLLCDVSGSMQGDKTLALQRGVEVLYADLALDGLARLATDIAIATFDTVVNVVQPFVTVDDWADIPRLRAGRGATFLGTAVLAGLAMLDARLAAYQTHGVPHYKPWLMVITDGQPQQEDPAQMARAAAAVREREQADRLAFFGIAVDNADMDELGRLSHRPPQKLRGLAFDSLFVWVSQSVANVSRSRVGERVSLPPTDWSEV